MICQIHDSGHVQDPMIGRPPTGEETPRGRALRVANEPVTWSRSGRAPAGAPRCAGADLVSYRRGPARPRGQAAAGQARAPVRLRLDLLLRHPAARDGRAPPRTRRPARSPCRSSTAWVRDGEVVGDRGADLLLHCGREPASAVGRSARRCCGRCGARSRCLIRRNRRGLASESVSRLAKTLPSTVPSTAMPSAEP